MSKVPTLETKRLFLREVTMADEPAIKRHFIDYEVVRFLSYKIPWPYPEDGAKDYLENVVIPNQGKDRWIWGIYKKNNPKEMIGCIDMFKEGATENRGFWLSRGFWGRHIMSEAIPPTLKFAFNECGFEKMKFANAVGNLASRKIKERTGCKFMGLGPAKFVDPSVTEREMWELTKEDWINHQASIK